MAWRPLRRAGTRSILGPSLAMLALITSLSVGHWVVESLATDGASWEPGAAALFDAGGNEPYHVWEEGQVWRLVTSIFLHANGLHLGMNMLWMMLLFILVQRLGVATGRESVVVVAVTALVGQVASALASPAMSVGASGGVFGLLGFSVARGGAIGHTQLSVWQRWSFLVIGLLALFVVLQPPDDPTVDRAAHLGGLVGGFLLGWMSWMGHYVSTISVCTIALLCAMAQLAWMHVDSPIEASLVSHRSDALPLPALGQQGWLSREGRCLIGPAAPVTPVRCSLLPLRAAAISGPVADVRRAQLDLRDHVPLKDGCVERQVEPGPRGERLLAVREGLQVLVLVAREPTWGRLNDLRRRLRRAQCRDT